MKKLLILALLFMGCESWGVFKHEHEGGCARRTSTYVSNMSIWGSNKYKCYSNWTENDCLSEQVEAQNSDHVAYDYVYISCEEFCNQESSWECEIDNDAY